MNSADRVDPLVSAFIRTSFSAESGLTANIGKVGLRDIDFSAGRRFLWPLPVRRFLTF